MLGTDRQERGGATTLAPPAPSKPAAEQPAPSPTAAQAHKAGNLKLPELPLSDHKRLMDRFALLMLKAAKLDISDLLKVWPETSIDAWAKTFEESDVAKEWVLSFSDPDLIRIAFMPHMYKLIQDRLGVPLGGGENHQVTCAIGWPQFVKGASNS